MEVGSDVYTLTVHVCNITQGLTLYRVHAHEHNVLDMREINKPE